MGFLVIMCLILSYPFQWGHFLVHPMCRGHSAAFLSEGISLFTGTCLVYLCVLGPTRSPPWTRSSITHIFISLAPNSPFSDLHNLCSYIFWKDLKCAPNHYFFLNYTFYSSGSGQRQVTWVSSPFLKSNPSACLPSFLTLALKYILKPTPSHHLMSRYRHFLPLLL